MKDLIRTKVNNFKIEDAIKISEIKEVNQSLSKKIISIEKIFMDKQEIILNDRKKMLFLNGVRLTFEKPNDIYRIYSDNQFIGLGIVEKNLLKRDVII